MDNSQKVVAAFLGKEVEGQSRPKGRTEPNGIILHVDDEAFRQIKSRK